MSQFQIISLMNHLTHYVPRVEPPLHIILGLVNCIPFLSGFGTMIGAVLSGMNTEQLLVGLMQYITMWLFGIGYLWSVFWGFLIILKGGSPKGID